MIIPQLPYREFKNRNLKIINFIKIKLYFMFYSLLAEHNKPENITWFKLFMKEDISFLVFLY